MPKLSIAPTCISCDNCRLICPEDAILIDQSQFQIDEFTCTICNLCVVVCPVDAIKLE